MSTRRWAALGGLDELGVKDNTIVFYIWGDNGSSRGRPAGHDHETPRSERIPSTFEQHINALRPRWGLDALGGPKVDNMYHAGWAWAGDRHSKYEADRLAFRRHAQSDGRVIGPRASSRTRHRDHSSTMSTTSRRPSMRFLTSKPPKVVDRVRAGPDRRRKHGLHLRPTPMRRPQAHAIFRQQRQSRNLSRGWYAVHFRAACSLGHRRSARDSKTWDSSKDVWEAYDITKIFRSRG